MASPSELAPGASVAAATPTISSPTTVTRADIVGPARRRSLSGIETPSSTTSSLIFPSDLSRKNYMHIGISNNNRTSSLGIVSGYFLTNDIQNTKTFISLPLPENIKDVTQIAYSESAVVGGSNLIGAAAGGIAGALSNVTRRLSRIPGLGSAVDAAAGVGNALAEPAYNDIVAMSGHTPNQMLTVLLQGPKYKSHSFTWKLYPRDANESKTIKKIIHELKISARPKLNLGAQFFVFPQIFNLSFVINGKDLFKEEDSNNYLFAFKPAVLEGIAVNYTPSGQPAIYSVTGAPDGVEITLNFKEVEYWTGEDLGDELPPDFTPAEAAALATGSGAGTATDGGQAFGPGGLTG